MSEPTGTELETEVATWIERIIPRDEEKNPLPWLPSPGMLVARVTGRLAQAAFLSSGYYDDCGGESEHQYNPLGISVGFVGAAALANTAIPHIHPDGDHAEPTDLKRFLIRELDGQVARMIEEQGRLYEDAEDDPDVWLRTTLALLTGALQGVPEHEQAITPLIGARLWEDESEDLDDLDPDDPDDDDEDDRDTAAGLREQIADSLFQAAVMAAAAGQWWVERQPEEETDYSDDEAPDDDEPVSYVPEDYWRDLYGPGGRGDLSEWYADRRWSYRDSRASASSRRDTLLTIGISEAPNGFARRLRC